MNRVAMAAAERGFSAIGWAPLNVCARPGAKLVYLPFYLLMTGGGMLLLGLGDAEARFAAPWIVGAGTMALWYGWCARLVLLARHARQAQVPGLERAVSRALALAVLATVLVPALVLTLLGADAARALALAAGSAAAGVLFAVLPGMLIALLYVGAPVVFLLWSRLVERVPALGGWAVDPGFVRLGAVLALSILAAGLWRALVRERALATRPRVLQPMVALDDLRRQRTGELWEGWPDAFRPRLGVTGIAPGGSKALRAWLGSPFAPLSRRGWLEQAGWALLILCVAAFLIDDLVGGFRLLVFTAAAGVLMLLSVAGQRLDALRKAPSGEYAELALLPGFGGADAARRLLLRSVLAWFARPALILPGFAVIGLLTFAVEPGRFAAVLLSCAGAVLLGLVCCLEPLSGRALRSVKGFLRLLPGIVLLAVSIAILLLGSMQPHNALLLAGCWLAMGGGYAWYARTLWRRIQARPHPFLHS